MLGAISLKYPSPGCTIRMVRAIEEALKHKEHVAVYAVSHTRAERIRELLPKKVQYSKNLKICGLSCLSPDALRGYRRMSVFIDGSCFGYSWFAEALSGLLQVALPFYEVFVFSFSDD